ncbi:retrovirus-related Pol polyprotein from transposon 412 [Nephila pilipes]|uniref:Retrovirus-related Pol polyprotein from transposon 412 n=1 Tax=Nephila pilipes TaxID=299642 RepID=A0A8X6TD85_NEPPI|nr:retrovirus-related Pol polyprotein from transposon 412 [Nephila pilipes]
MLRLPGIENGDQNEAAMLHHTRPCECFQTWCKSCIRCQQHIKTSLGLLSPPDSRFSHIHIVVVGPPSIDYKFVLISIDRFSTRAEVFPRFDETAETVSATLFSEWISHFGILKVITTDRTIFESDRGTDEVPTRHRPSLSISYPMVLLRRCIDNSR